jgi:transcriptional regulator of acetoin/glycerol metabolism
MEALLAYPWPGNVRELRNAIEYAFVLCSGDWIAKEHLPPKISMGGKRAAANRTVGSISREEERTNLIQTLRRVGGNQSEAARMLGVSRVTIWKRIKKYGIDLNSDLGRVVPTASGEPAAP